MRRSDYTCIASGTSFDRSTSGEGASGSSRLDAAGQAAEAEGEALLRAGGGEQAHLRLLEQQAPQRGARRGSAPRRVQAAALASACLALAACASWLGARRRHDWGGRHGWGDAALSKASEDDGGGEGCDCSWASVSTCGQDDGGHCFEECCFETANRTCKLRSGCTCDCSWANQSSCNYDDGGCCFTCCCGAAFVGAGTKGPQCALTDRTEARPHSEVEYHPGSIFCWSLMLPKGYERHLLAAQYRERVSIFACDQAAVYSNKRIKIADAVFTRVVDVDLQCESGGEFKTALNNDIFLAVWRKVIDDGDYLRHNWTVKVDPDTVFLPWRLRDVLKDHPTGSKGVYLNNCEYGLHGPLEVFSQGAVKAWGDGQEECSSYFEELCSGNCWWGEDMYIDQCLCKVLGVRRDDSPKLLVENHCNPPEGWESCNNSELVAFHPFKEEKRWMECLGNADRKGPPPPTTTTSTTVTTSTTSSTTRTVTGTTMTATYTATSRITIPDATTEPVNFDCNASLEQWRNEWSEGKMDWCCQRYGLGCLSEEDAVKFATNCTLTATWELDWPENKKRFCCEAYQICEASAAVAPTLAPQPTSALQPTSDAPADFSQGCDAQCHVGADTASCSSFIQLAAGSQFAGQPAPCAEALVEVITKCPACQACSLADANCVAMPFAAAQPLPQVVPAPPLQALLAPEPTPFAPAAAAGDAAASLAQYPRYQQASDGVAAAEFPLSPSQAPLQQLRSTSALGDELDCESPRTPIEQKWCCDYMDKGCSPPAGVMMN